MIETVMKFRTMNENKIWAIFTHIEFLILCGWYICENENAINRNKRIISQQQGSISRYFYYWQWIQDDDNEIMNISFAVVLITWFVYRFFFSSLISILSSFRFQLSASLHMKEWIKIEISLTYEFIVPNIHIFSI